MNKIKTITEMEYGTYIVSIYGQEWLLRDDNILLHRSERNRRGNIDFHRQLKVRNKNHAINYIAWHTCKYTYTPRKTRLEKLFDMI